MNKQLIAGGCAVLMVALLCGCGTDVRQGGERTDLLHLSHVHRGGGAKEAPDNTLETFRWCWENGSAVECDCRRTRDGVGIMLHDDTLARTGRGIPRSLATNSVSKALAWNEIKAVDVGSYQGERFKGQHVPTIEATFAAMKGHPTYLAMVDEKGAGPEYIARKAIEAGVQDQVYYTGPSHDRILDWNRILPGGKSLLWLGAWPKNRSPGERARADRWFRAQMAKLRARDFRFITAVSIHTYYDPKDAVDPFIPSTAVLREMIDEFHAHGIAVCSIPFAGGDREETYFKLWELGCDAFSTDYPSVMFNVIRKLKAAGGTRTVELGDGPAFGGKPLVLGAEASGTTYVAKPGTRPVVTAGRRVMGWTVGADGTWRARTDGFGRFEQLYVNGRLRQRPFLPRQGYSRVAAKVPCEKTEPQKFVVGEGVIDANWPDLKEIEVCMIQYWTMDRTRITGFDAATRTVTVDLQARDGNRPYGPQQWFRLDNVRAAFGEPGDWYLEKDGTLLYRPLPGETPETTEVIAPVGACALTIDGASDVVFRGITFSHAGHVVPEGGCSSAQAAVKAPAAVCVTRSRNVRFEDCAFVNVGGYALEFGRGAADCAVTGSVFSGLGAGGVRIGGTDRDDPASWATRCTVEGCLVEHGGRFDPAGVGVLVLNGNDCRIVRNTIRDLYYSGISCGWTWDRRPSGAFGNVIEANDISAIGQGVLTDMGGIYLLGEQRGTLVRRNVIRYVRSHGWNGIGLYLDQGCALLQVEENFVDDCTDGAFFVQYNTASNVVARNVFCRGGSAQLWHSGSFPERTLPTDFRDNVLWWDDPKVPIAKHFFHPRFIASTNNVAGCAGLAALPATARGVTLREMPPPASPTWNFGCPRTPRLAEGLPAVPQTFSAGLTPSAQRPKAGDVRR